MQLPLLAIESLIYAHNISTGGSDVVRELLRGKRGESSVLGDSLSHRDTGFGGMFPCILGGTMAGNAGVVCTEPYALAYLIRVLK